MQLLNSKILSNDKNTRYSNKKAQDTRVTCAFLSVVAFSYYKDGGDAGICLTAIVTEGQSRAAEGGSHGYAVLRFVKIAINPRFGIKKEQPLLFLFWWRCGDLNPGSSFYTRHLLHAYSVIKFSYRRSPTDGGFEEAENADLLTAVGKSVARSV